MWVTGRRWEAWIDEIQEILLNSVTKSYSACARTYPKEVTVIA